MTWEPIEDHLDRALESRAGPFQELDAERALTPIVEVIQEIEDLAGQLLAYQLPANAIGVWLEELGAIVGEPNLGDGTAWFRIRIQLALAAIYSDKSSEAIWTLLDLIPDLTWALGEDPGFLRVVQTGIGRFSSAALVRLLHVASADGVIVDLLTNEDETEEAFYFGSFDAEIEGSVWGSFDEEIEGVPFLGGRIR